MTTQWINSVQQTGELKVKFSSQLANSSWNAVVRNAVREFNRLTQKHQLGVQLKIVSTEAFDVVVNIADGDVTFNIDKTTSHRISLSGTALQGHTSNLSRSGKQFKSYIFLPNDPQVNTPNGQRSVGNKVKLVIAVHEFIHCCGLSNQEHSHNDIFNGYPTVDYGEKPNQDVLIIPSQGKRRTAPPTFIESTTVSRLRALWPHKKSSNNIGKMSGFVSRHAVFTAASSRTGESHGSHRLQGPNGLNSNT
jgi:hypothetical protein